MIPVKIAILWHFHQPYYKKDDRFIMPWVRLHGIKDYWDLPELFYEYPNIKQTINMVPSLDIQVKEYVTKSTFDNIQLLSFKKASELTEDDKNAILDAFFRCNEANLIQPYNRFRELFDASKDHDKALAEFTENDWLDLQVWYNLTWLGQFSRKKSFLKRLFIKERNFTEEEKNLLLDIHLEILSSINSQLKMLADLGQLELCCSPMYHPILPLLCNSEAVHEATPDQPLPNPIFRYPQDAEAQISSSLKLCTETYGKTPNGMWPSEGSLSDEVLDIFANNNVSWVATDEAVLYSSADNVSGCAKYFPRKYITKSKKAISIFFRNHSLSDAIGFVYANWNPRDAALDFTNKLKKIKFDIVNEYGEDALNYAVIPVILDGENCWEYYKENGINFLRELYNELANPDEFKTVTFSETLKPEVEKFVQPLNHIRAGSWINADFKIWLGHNEHVIAWSYLSILRGIIEEKKEHLSPDLLAQVIDEIHIAEGSDWFWWYGDSNWAQNKTDFDILFRWRLQHIYELMKVNVPDYLNVPINQAPQIKLFKESVSDINPIVNSSESPKEEWDNAACYNAKIAMSGAMHQAGEIIDTIYFGKNINYIYLKIEINDAAKEPDKIIIEFHDPTKIGIIINKNYMKVISKDERILLSNFEYSFYNSIMLALPIKAFIHDGVSELNFNVKSVSNSKESNYPLNGSFKIKL